MQKIVAVAVDSEISADRSLEIQAQRCRDIDRLISRIPELGYIRKTGPTSDYCRLRENHIAYVLTALKALATRDYAWMHSGLTNKTTSLEALNTAYQPIQALYDGLGEREKYLLAVTAYFHDIYYRFYDKDTPDHGAKGADYLKQHPELLAPYGLDEAEQTLVRDLIRFHSFQADIGVFCLIPDLQAIPTDPTYQTMSTLLAFLDLAKPNKDGSYSNRGTERVAKDLVRIQDQLPDLLAHPDRFYQVRLRSFLTPSAYFKLPDGEYQSLLAQLDRQPDSEALKQFLNQSLYMGTVIQFEKMYRTPGVFPVRSDGQKDFSVFFTLIRRVMQLAQDHQMPTVRLAVKNEKSVYEVGLTEAQDQVRQFVQQLCLPGDAWRGCFEVDQVSGAVLIL